MATEPARGWSRWRRARRLPTLNLALQGGGAHGAFTWGVLDRLLEDERFAVEGISGTSAGALNAVVLASGWLAGGAEGGRRALETLWREIAALARFSPLRAGGLTQIAADFTAQLLSPYQLNPLGLNPLRADRRPAGRFRAAARRAAPQAVHRRDQPAHRARPGLRQRRAVDRG